ncbi:hypothetical protein LCGC14_1336410, partial [marine sediment metagenome]
PEMFGQRLMTDMTERPEFYFARKELAKTEADLEAFQRQIMCIYYSLKFYDRTNGWWMDERACEATFKCAYTHFCYNNIPMDPDNLPEGFVSIFKKEKKDESV